MTPTAPPDSREEAARALREAADRLDRLAAELEPKRPDVVARWRQHGRDWFTAMAGPLGPSADTLWTAAADLRQLAARWRRATRQEAP